MPSKKRKYNARFPAGRIKKIMQTDEEVGKVAQAVPIIISRTLELFVESLLTKALQVTMARSAKTLSPAHVKHCILAEARFDFLRHLVKNIPDVSAADEKDEMSAENSPNTSRFQDMPAPPRRVVRQDSNSSSSSDVRLQPSTTIQPDPNSAIDLTKKITDEPKNTANFYQETLNMTDEKQGVIKINPTYATAQPSTSGCTNTIKEIERLSTKVQNQSKPVFHLDLSLNTLNNNTSTLKTPVTPLFNIDFSKNIESPEIKLLPSATNIVGVNCEQVTSSKVATPKPFAQDSKPQVKMSMVTPSLDVDRVNSGSLQIDEDYDT